MPTSLKDFETVFPQLVEDMKDNCKRYNLPNQALTWFEKVHTPSTSPSLEPSIDPSDT